MASDIWNLQWFRDAWIKDHPGDTNYPWIDSLYSFSGGTLSDAQIVRAQGNTPYLRGGKTVSRSGNYSPLNGDAVTEGVLDPVTGFSQVGSNSIAVQSAGFAFVAQTPFVDTVTLYWDGTNGSSILVVRRGDKTAQAVPPGSIAISGLSAASRYYLLPFWSNQNVCNIGWVPGTVGSPMICFTANSDIAALSKQNWLDRDSLSNGFMYFDTPAVGGSGGGGTGGGGSTGCVMHSCTDIEPLEGAEYSVELLPCSDWWRLEVKSGRTLVCTPDHPVYTAVGDRVEARSVKVGDWLTMKYGDDVVVRSEPMVRKCTKAKVVMPRIHLFWANEFLCHNFKPALPLGE